MDSGNRKNMLFNHPIPPTPVVNYTASRREKKHNELPQDALEIFNARSYGETFIDPLTNRERFIGPGTCYYDHCAIHILDLLEEIDTLGDNFLYLDFKNIAKLSNFEISYIPIVQTSRAGQMKKYISFMSDYEVLQYGLGGLKSFQEKNKQKGEKVSNKDSALFLMNFGNRKSLLGSLVEKIEAIINRKMANEYKDIMQGLVNARDISVSMIRRRDKNKELVENPAAKVSINYDNIMAKDVNYPFVERTETGYRYTSIDGCRLNPKEFGEYCKQGSVFTAVYEIKSVVVMSQGGSLSAKTDLKFAVVEPGSGGSSRSSNIGDFVSRNMLSKLEETRPHAVSEQIDESVNSFNSSSLSSGIRNININPQHQPVNPVAANVQATQMYQQMLGQYKPAPTPAPIAAPVAAPPAMTPAQMQMFQQFMAQQQASMPTQMPAQMPAQIPTQIPTQMPAQMSMPMAASFPVPAQEDPQDASNLVNVNALGVNSFMDSS